MSTTIWIRNPDELAMINYTSGTTGFSKGVMVPYRALWGNADFAEDVLGKRLSRRFCHQYPADGPHVRHGV